MVSLSEICAVEGHIAAGFHLQMLSSNHKDVSMYTVRGLIDAQGQSSVLANATDWNEAREKASEFRKQGMKVEIWHQDGKKIHEPEIDTNA